MCGVSKFTVKARDVYIADAEYLAIYQEATPALQCAMEIAYHCAVKSWDMN